MYDANVRGTERVLDAAFEAGVARIVYVSTINVFGNTRGEVVDESYERRAERRLPLLLRRDEVPARTRSRRSGSPQGAPIVIVQPGGVYGPGDHSEVGNMIDQTAPAS